MKKSIQLTCLSLLLVLITAACSKEKRYEHKLSRKGGLWTIAEYKHQLENDTTSIDIAQEFSGTIQFNENGTYTQNLIVEDTTYVETGTWSNSELQLKLTTNGASRSMGFNTITKKKIIVKSTDIDFNVFEYEFYAMQLTRKD
jgi:ABC-type Fe3+-citrate transport system substrate-binding protein